MTDNRNTSILNPFTWILNCNGFIVRATWEVV